jgi:conjugal transfer/entry exclusion protein
MTHRALVAVVLVVLLMTVPASAQFAVIDPENLAQAILIVQRTQRQYEQLREQYRTIVRMAQGLGRMEQYRTPPFALTHHDAERWNHGRAWIAALNGGDATGAAYLATAQPLTKPHTPARLSAAARRAFERQYATAEISDSVAMMGGHQVGLMRGYFGQMQRAAQALERDVLNPDASYHEMTAILDKVAAGELLGRRQDMATNQLLSHALEQLLARSKRQRDTETSTLNMQIVTWRDGEAANRAFRHGVGDALSSWRQP